MLSQPEYSQHRSSSSNAPASNLALLAQEAAMAPGGALDNGIVLGEHAPVSPSDNITNTLQYTPVDPNDPLELVVTECMEYLGIPKHALGYATLQREAPG